MGRRSRGHLSGGSRPTYVADPTTGCTAELRRIEPYAARKPYRCPGCSQDIAPGTGHVVIVPLNEPEARRHWHSPCFENRRRRPPPR